MVGVPGKYKGCNTCRMRRVKCDNERPFCRKCVDSGRKCLGYERETVFIVGTVEDKGRCSSHPPRNSKGSKKSPSPSPSPPWSSEVRSAGSKLVPAKPLQSAWGDQTLVSNARTTHRIQVATLYTPLSGIARGSFGGNSETTAISIPPYRPIDVRPTFSDADFVLHSQCLAHISLAKDDPDSTAPESIMLFLFEQNSSLASSNIPSWSDPVGQQNRIRQLGPGNFQAFPEHFFFARLYRPNAITTALLNHKDTFCADTEWTTVPFELHHKCSFDRLLDLMAQAPAMIQRLDHLLVLDPTLARRLMAQDLLVNCVNLQAQLEQWYAAAVSEYQPRYWVSPQENGEIPFSDTFSFQDPLTALSFTYYWSVQVLMIPCLEMLVHSIFTPVVDVYPPVFPDFPPQLNVNPDSYGPRVAREMAGNVCRGLDYALATTTQPDMLAFPAQVVETFYGALNVQAGDGALELMWLGGFRGRMALRGQDLADVVMGKGWTDLAAW